MGATCCIAAKDRTIVHGPSGGTLQRHVRYSPSWSFRWDNRVAGEETHANLHDEGVRNYHLEVKSRTTVQTAFASEEGSPRDSLCLHWPKSSVSDGNADSSKLQDSDETISRTALQVKESIESPSVSHPSLVKLSPLAASVSISPRTSQNHLHRQNLTPSRCHRCSRGSHFLHQVSATHIAECKSPPFSISEEASAHLPPYLGSESTRGSNGGSADSWSIPVFSELMSTRRERCSFDGENSGFSVDNIDRSSWRSSDSPIDLQNCGVCARLLSERSLWGWSCQKIVSNSELAVVSILNCGHVYHAECLEYMTPEINKYDPACPVCTYGEKQAIKMSEKALKVELDLKARKRSRKYVDRNLKSNIYFDRHKHDVAEGKGSKIGKPFMKRHFSFSPKSGKPSPGNQFARKKGFFWARSTPE